jgi:hypothetical protein
MTRTLVAVAATALCSGCFVFEELDHGEEVMEQLGPGKRKEVADAEQPPATTSGGSGPGMLERLKQWWNKAGERSPAPRDPSDRIVRCTQGGSVQFMRESDCQLRGGRVTHTQGEPSHGG